MIKDAVKFVPLAEVNESVASRRTMGMNISSAVAAEEDNITMTVVTVLMYSLLITVAVGGNLLVCYIILSRATMRTVTNLFLLNLAISDIVKAVICNPFTFVANLILSYWPFGEFMCPIVTYMQVVAVLLSAFTLVAISLDRFVAIVYPLRPKMSKKFFFKIMAFIWFLSFLVPLPTALTSKVEYARPKGVDKGESTVSNTTNKTDNWTGMCLEVFTRDSDKYTYSLIIMLLQYFIPLIIIACTNAKIGYIIWLKETPGEAERDRDRRMASSKRRVRSLK